MEKEDFWQAKEACDTRAMADFLVEKKENLLAEDVPMEASPLASKDVLLFMGRKAILDGEPRRAIVYANAWVQIVQKRECVFWADYYKCQGDALVQLKDDVQADRFYALYCTMNRKNADVHGSYGNVLFRLGKIDEARFHYEAAMNILRDQGENWWLAHNFLMTLGAFVKTGNSQTDAILQRTAWTELLEEPPVREIPKLSLSETFDLPIFINCRDRLGCLQKLVNWLLEAGYRHIYLLDNASTYLPLRDYYTHICRDPRVVLVQLPANLGHQAIWQSGVLHQLDIRTPYVYTDPDTVPIESCPRGILARFYQLLRKYPFVDKVGAGLMIDDLPLDQSGRALEHSYCQVPVEEEVFFAPRDTTFALYAPVYHYTNFMSLRTGGRMLVRHMPWYLDRAHLPEDEQYYINHANESSSFANLVKQGN